jgi:hypothetical protein
MSSSFATEEPLILSMRCISKSVKPKPSNILPALYNQPDASLKIHAFVYFFASTVRAPAYLAMCCGKPLLRQHALLNNFVRFAFLCLASQTLLDMAQNAGKPHADIQLVSPG